MLADATQVEQALLNLCTNAIHAIGTAKGTVRVDALPLRPDTALCDRLGLPAGDYAVSAFLDENNNMKLDSNLFGLPTELYGFSRNARNPVGPPPFEAAAFRLGDDTPPQTMELK